MNALSYSTLKKLNSSTTEINNNEYVTKLEKDLSSQVDKMINPENSPTEVYAQIDGLPLEKV